MDLQKAYKVFEAQKDINLVELEDKYLLWIRKSNSQHQKDHIDPSQIIDMEEITEAYNAIREHLHEQENGDKQTEPKNPTREKIEHFFHYYKIHMLIAISVIIFSIYMVQGIIDNRQEQARLAALPPIDIEIMMYGEYLNDDITPMLENISADFPEWDRIEVNVVYAPTEVRSEFDIGSIQKNSITLMNERPDIYIMDLHHLQIFADNPPFFPLDDIYHEAGGNLDSDRLYFLQKTDDESERLYGIDITGSHIFDDLLLEGQEKIATIRTDAKNKENAVHLLRAVMEELNRG